MYRVAGAIVEAERRIATVALVSSGHATGMTRQSIILSPASSHNRALSWAQQVPYLDRLGGGPCDHGYTHAITQAILIHRGKLASFQQWSQRVKVGPPDTI